MDLVCGGGELCAVERKNGGSARKSEFFFGAVDGELGGLLASGRFKADLVGGENQFVDTGFELGQQGLELSLFGGGESGVALLAFVAFCP